MDPFTHTFTLYYSAASAPAVALPRKSPGRAEQVPGHSRANAEGPGMGSVRGCCFFLLTD